MMILTKPQIATLEKAVATANNVLPRIEFLEALSRSSPLLAERVQELRAKRDYLHQLATSALDLNRQLARE
jgi:hypothetical protein